MRVPARLIALMLAALATTGCLTSFRTQPATVVTESSSTTSAPPAAEACEQSSTELAALRTRLERQRVELFAGRAEIESLRSRLAAQQSTLEEAIHEVVRARAKQRSVESRAQAATEIAETEIALERLSADGRDASQVEQAQRLLEGASHEFDAQNFGGALYLATQSKNRIRQAASGADAASIDGEEMFSAPVPLALVRRSNVRQGPGTEFPVLRTLDAGATLTGHASKGAWIRTTGNDGAGGWIHRSLVDGGS